MYIIRHRSDRVLDPTLLSTNLPPTTIKILTWSFRVVIFYWQVADIFALILQCWPTKKTWRFDAPGKCVDVLKNYLGSSKANVVTDLIITAIPLPLIRNSRISICEGLPFSQYFLPMLCKISYNRYVYIRWFPKYNVSQFALIDCHTCCSSRRNMYDLPYPSKKKPPLSPKVFSIVIKLGSFVSLGIWSGIKTKIGLVCACLLSMQFVFKSFTTLFSSTPAQISNVAPRRTKESVI